MLYVGIDAAKDKHDCHIFDSEGEVLCDNSTFANSKEGFQKLLELIKKFGKARGKTKVGLESTGHYSHNLLAFLEANDFEVVVFNPLSVNQSRKAGSLRKTKTDKNDARYIASLLVPDSSKPYQQQSYHIQELKSLTRARYRLVKEIQPVKNRYRRLIHILFPEIQRFFCKIDLPAVLGLLKELPSALDIASCNILTLTRILSQNSRGRFKRDKAEKLKSLAQNSIATYNRGDALELKLIVQRIEFMNAQKSELENEIKSIMLKLNSPITSIPGIGDILGAVILSEIGDRSFDTPAKLLAFAGCEPSSYQSGNYTATRTPMVKHGSKFLRNALFLATKAARLHSPSFTAYLARKKSQGKHEYVAISHGMKKMIRVIFSVLKSNTPYIEPI